MPQPKQPVTDDSIQVRQLSHYQFTWVASKPGSPARGPCSSCLTKVRGRKS